MTLRAARRFAVILCGGVGERFWPLTDETHPKYALRLGGETLLARTWQRLLGLYRPRDIYVVTAAAQRAVVRRLLPRLASSHILSEPMRRNTAGAVTYATLFLSRKHGDCVISFFPADAVIQNDRRFRGTLRQAAACAASRPLIALVGVRPRFPATGFGYIESGPALGPRCGCGVRRFIEKPPLAKARRLFKNRKCLWNAGIFTWRASLFEREMRRHAPGYFSAFEKAFRGGLPTGAELEAAFRRAPVIPIDRLLIEKSRALAVFRGDFGWDDVGSWDAFRRVEAGRDGNVIVGGGIFEKVRRSLVVVPPDVRVAAYGIENLAVIQKGKHLLVCPLDRAQEVTALRRAILRPRKRRR